jgi:hypothetical protein
MNNDELRKLIWDYLNHPSISLGHPNAVELIKILNTLNRESK